MFKSWSYEVLDQSTSVELGSFTFENVAIIQNSDDENLIERRYVIEQYAPEVGLISRDLLILDTQCNVCCQGDFATCEPIDWKDKAERGFILRQRLTDFN